jgi:hypothetical protein
MNRHFNDEEIQTANQKRSSILQPLETCKLRPQWCPYTSVRIPKIKVATTPSADEVAEWLELAHITGAHVN